MSEVELVRPLLTTPLHAAHVAAGARMTPFAGYDMPVQYRDGVLKEHLWTREHAGIFDVSHMGPAFLTLNERSDDHEADHRAVSAIVETLVTGDIAGLKPGQLRYTLLLNDQGGMIDDLMIGRPVWENRQGMLYIVVNAATKDGDFALIEQAAAGKATLTRADDRALIAIQGPEAAAVLAGILPESAELGFMQHRRIDHDGHAFVVSRSGYTGEDGFEVLVPRPIAEAFWNDLLADERVRPIGLGARDSLRLEAGLPLYGHDADETVSPIEANLAFAVSKKRLKAGDIPGAARIARELAGDLTRVRVGLKVLQGAPAREGAEIADASGAIVGRVTSGGFAPSLPGPIAMGFVPPALSALGTALNVIVRGKPQAAEVVALPFVPHRYIRKS
ncbi:MAG: glycine cleavage system aminomethyltransferase GcvT [Caulobacteraceae bacterium]|nr:glycine cleavage system aminomethyltransferase GcvT [Caulobacteraceae bacterium]